MIYRVGWPFWKLAYKLGFTLYYRYDVYRNHESNDYCAASPDIKGLNAEAKSLDEVCEAMEYGAQEIVKLDLFGIDEHQKEPTLRPFGKFSGGVIA